MDITRSNEFVPYQLVRRSIDPALLSLRDAIRTCLVRFTDSVVIDVAAGGGLLSAWAAECDSVRRVYVIEDDPLLLYYTRRALSQHARRERIALVAVENLLTYMPPEACDLLLCEVLSTGLLHQPQMPLLNHYLPFVKPTGMVLPSGIRNSLVLTDFDFVFAGSLIRFSHLFEDGLLLARAHELHARATLNTLSFQQPIPAQTKAVVSVPITATGWAKSLVFSTDALVGDQAIMGSLELCPRLVAPLQEPYYVEAGQTLKIKCRFPHRDVDEAGRASAGPLPERLDIEISSTVPRKSANTDSSLRYR